MEEAFCFNIAGDFAFFKKNDANDTVLISYNFIHKPAVLGIMGAILGLKGYPDQSNEFYEKLKNFKIAIIPKYTKPLTKFIVVFNDSSGLSSKEEGGILQVREQVLFGKDEPIRYEIVVPLRTEFTQSEVQIWEELRQKVSKKESVYPLYFGKNEFPAYIEEFSEIYLKKACTNKSYKLKGLAVESCITMESSSSCSFLKSEKQRTTIYEQLPIRLNESWLYEKETFVLTENSVKINSQEDFRETDDDEVIFLF